MRRAAVAACVVWASGAQAQDSARASLPGVHVTATRDGPRSAIELPFAVTIARPDSFAALRRAGVDELLFAVPGVLLANRQNPAQDPRVSIRGFGARSAFGVRGVRVLQDGVPVTLPDGQTPVDVLDIENADRVDVIRGSASALYGNAAGGVIELHSVTATPVFSSYGRVAGGRNVPLVKSAGASDMFGGVGVTSSIERITGRGYRDYSDQRATKGAVRFLFGPHEGDGPAPIAVSARYSEVIGAEGPGALTRAQFDANPEQADPQSVLKRAGKTVHQGDLSLVGTHDVGAHAAIDGSVYGSVRSLTNPTTFAIVDLARATGGASVKSTSRGTLTGRPARFTAGADAQWLNDDRQEYANCVNSTCAGGFTERGALTKNQRELVNSVGPFARAELDITPTLLASAGVRSDAIAFRVRDRLITATNPDDSGDRTLHAVSPSAGLVWRARPLLSLYGSVSSSFETPTTTELGNKADGSAGINPDLQPQRTVTYEVGSKGLLASNVRWDVAAFEAHARDELVPFDIPNGNGRRYYRNAGRTVRRGAETGVEYSTESVSLRSSYSFSHFRYVEYSVGAASYAGHRIPGVPEQALMTSASWRVGQTTLSTTADLASPFDVDDANTAQAPGRAVFGLSAARHFQLGGADLSELIALQNIGNVHYMQSVSVNATGGKFYEPAPGRLLLFRVSLSHGGER